MIDVNARKPEPTLVVAIADLVDSPRPTIAMLPEFLAILMSTGHHEAVIDVLKALTLKESKSENPDPAP